MTDAPTHVAQVRGEAGAGPALVYVPGIDGSGELLLGTAEKLARRYRLVRLCYRTLGPVPPGGDSYEALARSVVRCLDERGVDEALVLAESFGGAVAIRTALLAPERVRGLAIVNSFVRYDRPLSLSFARVLRRMTPNAPYRLVRRLFGPLALMHPRRDAAAAAAFRRAELLDDDVGYVRRMRMIAEVDLRSRLGEVRCPVALFASDSDRVVRSVPAAQEMAAGLPDVTLEILPRGGHMVLPLASEPWEDRLEALEARCTPTAAR